jgi:hypothetical protein
MKPSLTFLLLSVFLVPLTGCEMPDESRPGLDDMTPGAEHPVPGKEVIWVITLKELGESGYRMLEEKTIESTGDFETRWQDFASPFRYEGRRVKIVGRVDDVEGMPGHSRVRMAAWAQRNADIKNPMNLSQAIWQDVEPDSGIVEVLLYRIDNHFQ